ncbi:hypothetical protein EV196_101417 [Mariniflexile fucanivorans]|uniref:Uncharacterized protein n=1 Tax=Mariniflexile fucanivorans TaxID=264023 RepID=A0A4R1RSI6_9FLAO|nr:hypothetical protein [Mariniflexile fucanivorans]TCL68990.1 hypothetical protein EV196_101417 [Mariniflexile fucanivorans]
MENSFFVFTDNNTHLQLERFHICTWEFNNNSSLIEFGFEVNKETIKSNSLAISLFIPWMTKACEVKDLYDNLKVAENSRFIFNDSVTRTDSLDGGRNKFGVIHGFTEREDLCILPIIVDKSNDQLITATVNLKPYNDHNAEHKPNIYFRFWIKPSTPYISMRKKGMGKSTIIYDLKINEKRNIPDNQINFFSDKELCDIENCFLFNIVPNKYDILFFDNSSLKNVRTLEHESFNKYLGDKRVKKDELIVVFNKKKGTESYSFFSIYSKERIGLGQFSLAILINIVCGILLFIPAYRRSFNPEMPLKDVWNQLPAEIFIAVCIFFATLIYFIWPWIKNSLDKGWDLLKKK